jgi:hypothetical protein
MSGNRQEFGVNLGNGRELPGLLRRIQKRLLIAERKPHASQTAQDNPTLGIGNDHHRAFALGCFAPRVYLYHGTGPC